MPIRSELVRDFYGNDPIVGEDAKNALIENGDPQTIEALVPLDHGPVNSSLQSDLRLKAIATAFGMQIVPHLARVISTGPWRCKLVAAPCFGGLKECDATVEPLIDILKKGGNFDAERLAIQALGYLGAREWAYDLRNYAMCGRWGLEGDARNISQYAFEKLSSYVLEAIAQFAAKSEDRSDVIYLLDLLTDFIALRQFGLPNQYPDSYQLVARHGPEFTGWAVDQIISKWGKHPKEDVQYLCMDILGYIAPLRAAKFLLDIAISPQVSRAVRTGASIALGEIRHPQVAQRVADALRDQSVDRAHLDWAVSTLYAVPADWSGVSEFVDELATRDDEPASQLRYSLSSRGDSRFQNLLVEKLDSPEPFNRWTAALALVRLLGTKGLAYVEHRAGDAGDDMERCAMFAAAVRAGDEAKARDLHEALKTAPFSPRLRSVWRLEILDAFRTVRTFDPRAFPLWCAATAMGTRQLQYFDAIFPTAAHSEAKTLGPKPSTAVRRMNVFISYNRQDAAWLKRFQNMLSPLIRSERLDLWDDTKMKPGKWRDQIARAMSEAHVALFLVSEHFLASEFIMQHELPELLQYVKERGVTVVWVLLDDCLWEESPLSEYQGENPGYPLSRMSEGDQTMTIKQSCLKIRDILKSDAG